MVRDSLAGVLRVVGARSVTVGESRYVIRAASIGDPAGLQTKVLISEAIDHVTLPIVPMTVLLFGAMWFVLDRSLSLIEATARAVREADPVAGGVRLNLDRAPSEIAVLGKTVNTLLDRLDEVIKSHHDFAANVAHELRTPLSLILLDLENSQRSLGPARTCRSSIDVASD